MQLGARHPSVDLQDLCRIMDLHKEIVVAAQALEFIMEETGITVNFQASIQQLPAFPNTHRIFQDRFLLVEASIHLMFLPNS